MADDHMEEERELDLSDGAITDKYKAAAEIANSAMLAVLAELQEGKIITDICVLGDKFIEDATAKVYNKHKTDKGVAFPTCISVNNVVGHYSPMLSDDKVALKKGDIVKVDLGVHIDGFISQAAHTAIVGQGEETPLGGRAADAICAAYFASEIAHRLVKPGNTNKQVTEAINKVVAEFKCNLVEGVLSHQVKRFVIDGNKVILNKPSGEQQVEEHKFELNEVYVLDIVVSSGEGKAKEGDTRTSIFKRAVETQYNLRSAHSRHVLTEVNKKFISVPFNLRSISGKESETRYGMLELVNHDMVHSYPVLYEKEGEFVAQFKFTLLVLPSQTLRLNNFPLPFVSSEHTIENNAELQAILAQSTKRGKKKPAKKKAAPAAAPAGDKMDTTQ